jgi:hypothetical protein
MELTVNPVTGELDVYKEKPVNIMLAGNLTLIAGTVTYINANIVTSSIAVITPSTTGTLNGIIKADMSVNGEVTFTSTDLGDTCTFYYIIIC